MADVIRIEVKVEGDEELKRAFDLMLSRVQDWRPYWPDIANVFYIAERELFDSQGHGKWPRLSDGYEKWKKKHYPGYPIMQRSTELAVSLTNRYSPNSVYDLQPLGMTLGTTLAYADAHMRAFGNRPARPPIELTQEDINQMARVAVDKFGNYADTLGFGVKKD